MEGSGGYADSVDSSPRSRGGESWDEPYAAAAPAARLRLMCSYGGHIVPRPHDKSLCYLGGETRIVVVDRHTTLADLSAKLSRSLLGGRSFTLKYQLPSEDLDSLISVTTDEDLDNMVDEYDRVLGSGPKPARIRLFLFPAKAESAPPSIGSLLDDSKSETWFVDALNGAIVGLLPRGLSADSVGSSVNCLLGLEDDPSAALPAPPSSETEQLYVPQAIRPDSPEKVKPVPDVHSVPDSPMLDTTSSFGSASSTTILANLPRIRVRPDEHGPDPLLGAGLEEPFAQMSVLGQKQEESSRIPPASQTPLPFTGGHAAPAATATTPVISPTGNPSQGNRAFSDDEKSDRGGAAKPPLQQPPPSQPQPQSAAAVPKPTTLEVSTPQRAYYPDNSPSGLSTGSDGKQELVQCSVPESNFQPQMPPEPGFLIQMQSEKFQQQQQHQQYVHPNPQLMQHQAAPSQVLPFQSFYQIPHQMHSQQQMPQPHGYNQQIPMFFVPVPANANYGLPIQQQNLGDAIGISSQGKPTLPIPSSVLQTQGAVASPIKPEMVAGTNMYRTNQPAVSQLPQPLLHLGNQGHQQFMGYHPMPHHPSHSVAASPYQFPQPIQTQPLYYTQATSAPMQSHYQPVSSAAATTMIHDVPSQLQQPLDNKQIRSSS